MTVADFAAVLTEDSTIQIKQGNNDLIRFNSAGYASTDNTTIQTGVVQAIAVIKQSTGVTFNIEIAE